MVHSIDVVSDCESTDEMHLATTVAVKHGAAARGSSAQIGVAAHTRHQPHRSVAPQRQRSGVLACLDEAGRGSGGQHHQPRGCTPEGLVDPLCGQQSALNHTTRLLSAALGPDVRVNAVAPA